MGDCVSRVCDTGELRLKEAQAEFVFLLTEGNVRPFAKEIESILTRRCEKIVNLNLSESLSESTIQKYQDNSAIVICDVPYRQQESDISKLTKLGTKLKHMLIFYITPDEYSQLTLVSGEHIQEETLHRTHGNSISQQDADTIQKAIQNFISRVVSSAQIKSNLSSEYNSNFSDPPNPFHQR